MFGIIVLLASGVSQGFLAIPLIEGFPNMARYYGRFMIEDIAMAPVRGVVTALCMVGSAVMGNCALVVLLLRDLRVPAAKSSGEILWFLSVAVGVASYLALSAFDKKRADTEKASRQNESTEFSSKFPP